MINVPNPQMVGQICLDNYVYDPIVEPLTILTSFFSYQDLRTHLRMLKQWKNALITYDYLETSTVYHPLYEHKMICNLLNAAWLLIQPPLTGSSLKTLSRDEQESKLHNEAMQAGYCVKHLSEAELIDPYIGIQNHFEGFTLRESHEQLYIWLNTALSPNVMIDEELTVLFYRNLRRLITCCWLIYIRKDIDFEVEFDHTDEQGPFAFQEWDEDIIPAKVLSGFKQFLSVVPAQRLNRSLRKMLIDYLFYNLNGLPTDFEEMLTDFYWLTDLLDEIQGKSAEVRFS